MRYKKSAAILKHETDIVDAFNAKTNFDQLEFLANTLRAAHLNMCDVKIKAIRRKMETDLVTAEYAEVLNHEALWKALTADEIVRRCVAGTA